LQGWVDLSNVKWDAATRQLTGNAKVIGGEAFRIVLAGNGFKPAGANTSTGQAHLDSHPSGAEYSTLVLENTTTSDAAWSVKFDEKTRTDSSP
jgi:hypothetical protein